MRRLDTLPADARSHKKNLHFARFRSRFDALEVAITTLLQNTRVARRDATERMCITDPRRSRRLFYKRLETSLSRAVWEARTSGRNLESELLYAELHYVQHVRRKRPPCAACRDWTLERFR